MGTYETVAGLYKQREDFILLGLTGRSGSGCTTVAKILQTEDIRQLDLQSYKTCDFNNADERKYSVIYRFMKEGEKWKPFYCIEASSIIFSFVLEKTYGALNEFIETMCEEYKIEDSNSIRNAFLKALDLSEEQFAEKSKEVIDIEVENYLEEKNEKTVNYFTKILVQKKNNFAKKLKKCSVTVTISENSQDKQEMTKERDLYSHFMQVIGNNLRKSGDCFSNEEVPGKEITVASRIDDIITMIRKNQKENGKTRICIDALRCPVEIWYFRDLYRPFYVLAVNTENEDRQNRLGLTQNQMQNLDEVEYPVKSQGFYHQNIGACLEISDIYLYNPQVKNNKKYELTEQLLKYIALILHPGLIAPSHLERCMQLAFNAKYNSGCLSRQVGAVVTGNDFSVRAVGWNDVPKGQVPCNLRCVEDYCRNKDEESFSEYELSDKLFSEALHKVNKRIEADKNKKDGKCYSYCFKDVYNGLTGKKNQVHTRALHAEENAFLQISKYGGAEIQGGKLFTTASPCELCSKKAYQLGIKEIYYIDPYPGISKSHILTFGKKGNPKMIFFQGAIGNAYISLYSQRMPLKDELEMACGIEVGTVAKEIKQEHELDR